MNKLLVLLILLFLTTISVTSYADDHARKPFPKGVWTKNSLYKCYRADSKIILNGVLDDEAWKKAPVISNLWQADSWDFAAEKPVPGHFETQKTRARLLYDDKYIYIGAELDDTDILGMTTADNTDFVEGTDDIFEVFFKPDHKKPGYYEFNLYPTNAMRDLFLAKRGAGSYLRYQDYNSGMQSEVKLDGTLNDWHDVDKGWSLEMRIPLEAFNETGGGPKPGDRWQFLVSRYNYAYQLPYGSEVVQMVAMYRTTFHLYEAYPTIEFVK